MFLFGAIVLTHLRLVFESDLSIGCLRTHWRCGPCAHICYPMSDVSLVNLSGPSRLYRTDSTYDGDDDDNDDYEGVSWGDDDDDGDEVRKHSKTARASVDSLCHP